MSKNWCFSNNWIILIVLLGGISCNSSFNSIAASFRKKTTYGLELFYMPYGAEMASQLRISEASACEIEVYTQYKEPTDSYYIIGTCYLNPEGQGIGKRERNISRLHSCACLNDGDAIYKEDVEIQDISGSPPGGPCTISTPGGDVTIPRTNSGNPGMTRKVLI